MTDAGLLEISIATDPDPRGYLRLSMIIESLGIDLNEEKMWGLVFCMVLIDAVEYPL